MSFPTPVLSSYSVHTSKQALNRGEARIAEMAIPSERSSLGKRRALNQALSRWEALHWPLR